MSNRTEIDIQIVIDDTKVPEKMTDKVDEIMQQAIKDVAQGAYANIIAQAQAGLKSTRQDYLKGLSFTKLSDNEYLITLDGTFANALETGFAPYDMREKMLQSKKIVEIGPRSGEPWVQQGKKGKFAHVPFQQQPFSKAPEAQDMAQLIKKVEVTNARGRKQKITSIFKDISGKALEGEVARAPKGSDLAGLVKYQKIYENAKTGKKRTEGIYILYRTISENSPGWQHPGFSGLLAFSKTEEWVRKELENILKSFLE